MTNGGAGRGFSKDAPPLQPGAMQQYQANRQGLTSLNDKGLDERDPLAYCFPPGAARSMIMPYSFEIVQRPGVLYILFEFGSGIRRIYTDGRKHPEDVMPTWMGHSIGTLAGRHARGGHGRNAARKRGSTPPECPTATPCTRSSASAEPSPIPWRFSFVSKTPRRLPRPGAGREFIVLIRQTRRITSSARRICRWASRPRLQ